MTEKEKAIVMAYTGVCMLSGDKFKIFHEYVENIMGRPVYTHEMGIKAVDDEIKEKAKADFIALCAEQEPKTGRWIVNKGSLDALYGEVCKCSVCGIEGIGESDYCPSCGAKMVDPQESEVKDEDTN